MKDLNYINIQGWMINTLGLKGNELILYAIIYGFSQDGESEYYGSQRYIARAMKISVVTANKLINKLLEKGLIIRTGESHYKAKSLNKVKQGGVKESLTGVKESLTLGVKESLTNNNNTNNNYKDSAKDKPLLSPISFEKEIDKMLDDKREHINLIGYFAYKKRGRLSKTIKTRGALHSFIKRHLRSANELVKYYDLDDIKRVINDDMKKMSGEGIEWTLETVKKELTK